jgi:hypothetical protein
MSTMTAAIIQAKRRYDSEYRVSDRRVPASLPSAFISEYRLPETMKNEPKAATNKNH